MIRARNLRTLIKDVGPQQFKAKLREMLGIETKNNPEGTFAARVKKDKAQIGTDEFSIRDLYEEFVGPVASLHNEKTGDHFAALLREAMNPVTASNFTDINAFSQTIGGLLEARILAGYDLPEFISANLFETQATAVNGGKMIGLPNIQMSDGFTQEGMEYPSAGMQERWVIAGENKKAAEKLALTKEAVVYDRTGELLSRAEGIGQALGYKREYWCAAVAQGVDIVAGTAGFSNGLTCNTFLYNALPTDTPNSTYQTTAGTGTSLKYNFVNKLSNQLVDWKNVQTVQAKLNLMREYETGYPILAPLEEILVSPNSEYNARAIVHATQILDTSGASGLSTSGGVGTFAANPVPTLKIHSSAIWNKVLVDSGVSQSNADLYWYGGSFRRAFVWREVWPLSITQGNPLSNDAMERDVVNTFYASWFGVPVVRDGHYVINSTN